MHTFKTFTESTTQYKIVKTYVGTSKGGEKVAYDVVDAKDGYSYDTFSLRRDAKAWIDRAIKQEKSKQ